MPSVDSILDDANPVIDHAIPVPLDTPVKATPVGDLPDVNREPTFSQQDVINLITELIGPIANEHLIERAKAIQLFLGKE